MWSPGKASDLATWGPCLGLEQEITVKIKIVSSNSITKDRLPCKYPKTSRGRNSLSYPPHPAICGRRESYSPPLTNCSSQGSRPCTLPGQHSRAVPVDRGTGELALRKWVEEIWLHPHLPYGGFGEEEMPPSPPGRWQLGELALRS